MAITLPYRFDTCNIWRTILKGAFGLNAVLVFGILYTLLVRHQWGTSLGLALCELIVFGFTRVFIRFQGKKWGHSEFLSLTICFRPTRNARG